MGGILSRPWFHDEAAAFSFLESVIWPDGIVCPKCGVDGRARALEGVKDKKGRVRHGLKKCYACRAQFTVRVGTVFEASHVPLHLWLQAAHLLCSSKKGISSNQLHRILGVTLKTAWFMSHRLREAMRDNKLPSLGGEGKHVEADETFIGKKRERRVEVHPKSGYKTIERGTAHKHVVISLVERGGRARSVHVERLNRQAIYGALLTNIDPASRLQTDDARHYWRMKDHFGGGHGRVKHSEGEYVNGADHTQTVEGFFSIFKRGMKGIYQHCGERHLHRYLTEFDFRYNERIGLGVDDTSRTHRALAGIVGKRLMYRNLSGASV